MTAFVAWRARRRIRLGAWACAAVLAASPVFAAERVAAERLAAGAAGGPVRVHLDHARILKLPEHTATLVVGNPLIADAVVQPGDVAVLTAKSYGGTNLIALDRAGATLREYAIEVVGPSDPIVVVYRGIDRESYSCAPNCERRIVIGDTPAYFTQNLTALGSYSDRAQGRDK